jgi:hypothetical protein
MRLKNRRSRGTRERRANDRQLSLIASDADTLALRGFGFAGGTGLAGKSHAPLAVASGGCGSGVHCSTAARAAASDC